MQANKEKKSEISETIRNLIDSTGNNPNSFAKKLGYERSQAIYDIINGKAQPSYDFFRRLKNSEYSEFSIDKLLSGKNSVETKKEVSIVSEAPITFKYAKKEGIPLVSWEAVAGFGSASFCIAKEDVQEYYVVPDFKKIDFMISLRGSSMYPKYSAGDIVACRIIRESQFIQWNKTYIIATVEQGLLCKRLKPSDKKDHYLAVSDNKEYEPFDLPVSEVTGIALIVGVIRLE